MLLDSDPEIEVVGQVGNGRDAVVAVPRLNPDVVIMDVRMPVLNGVDATREIALAPGNANPPPVLILTTYNLDKAVYAALRAGAAGYLLKDAVPAELLKAVRALADGKGWLDPGVTRALFKEFADREDEVVLNMTGPLLSDLDFGSAAENSFRTAVFQLIGDFWMVSFGGQAHHIRNSIGLRYLRVLLGNPDSEMHVLDLVRAVQPSGESSGVTTRAIGHAGAALDPEAKAQYRRRITDLREELDEAESWADSARATTARHELEALTEELARSTGLGGRDRFAASAAERARISVTKALRASIRRIERDSPTLGKHLKASVRTGVYCCYAPEDSNLHWEL